MKKNDLNPVKLVWALVFVGFIGVFGYVRLLPSLFPPQRAVDPDLVTGEYDSERTVGEYLGRKVISYEGGSRPLALVLGSNDLPKRIEVDLSKQRVYAYEGETKVYDFRISSGRWYPTPTGTFTIWSKFRYTKMSGGNPVYGTYYYLPNVPYVMFFSNEQVAGSRGFSLHGTYWHNNFGYPMSHGCVNMRTEDAETLFYWSNPAVGEAKAVRANRENPGTQVIIYGEIPKE